MLPTAHRQNWEVDSPVPRKVEGICRVHQQHCSNAQADGEADAEHMHATCSIDTNGKASKAPSKDRGLSAWSPPLLLDTLEGPANKNRLAVFSAVVEVHRHGRQSGRESAR